MTNRAFSIHSKSGKTHAPDRWQNGQPWTLVPGKSDNSGPLKKDCHHRNTSEDNDFMDSATVDFATDIDEVKK